MDIFLLVSNIVLWVIVLFNLVLTLTIIRQMNRQGKLTTTGFHSVIDVPIGQPAPAFEAPLLSGETVSLQNYMGRKVLFLFSGPYCKACREILPGIASWIKESEQAGRTIVLVSDGPAEETSKFLHDTGLKIPTIIAPKGVNSFMDDYQVLGTPSFCSINEKGLIHAAGYPSLETGELKYAFN